MATKIGTERIKKAVDVSRSAHRTKIATKAAKGRMAILGKTPKATKKTVKTWMIKTRLIG